MVGRANDGTVSDRTARWRGRPLARLVLALATVPLVAVPSAAVAADGTDEATTAPTATEPAVSATAAEDPDTGVSTSVEVTVPETPPATTAAPPPATTAAPEISATTPAAEVPETTALELSTASSQPETSVAPTADRAPVHSDPDGTTTVPATTEPPVAERAGDVSIMAVMDVQPSSYDWGSLRVGEVGPWIPFAYDPAGYGGRISFGAEAGVELDTSGNFACGDRWCVNYRFAPTHRGTINANIYIVKVDTNEWSAVPTVGVGLDTEVAMEPTSHAFGDVVSGQTSTIRTVTFRNVGDYPVDRTGIQVTGPFSRVGGTCSPTGTMVVGASCTIDLVFSPTAVGGASGSVTVTTSQEPPAVTSLAGNGLSAQPTLTLTPATATFDPTPVGSTSRTVPFTVANTGHVPVDIARISASSEWTMASTNCPSTMAPATSCAVQVAFQPTAGGPRTGTLDVTSTAPALQARLSGQGLTAVLELDPPVVLFGGVEVGETSAPITVTVTNTGTASTTVEATWNGAFTVDTTGCAGTLAPGSTCPLIARFVPVVPGTNGGLLTVTGAHSSTTALFNGYGERRTATLTPAVDFGDVALGDSSTRSVVLHNTGNVDLTVGDAVLPAAVTVASEDCPVVLSAGTTCTLTLEFAPDAAGAFSGSMVLATSFGDLTTPLSGRGLPLQVTPTSLDLGTVTVAHAGSAAVTITNLDDAPVPLGLSAAIAPFTLTDDCPDLLAGNASCVVTVAFAPPTAGAATSTFTISSPADGSLQAIDVDLAGLGVAAELTVDPVDVGLVFVGEAATTTATITNTGPAAVTVTDVTVAGPFGIASATPCMTELAPDETCSVEVTFAPTAPGAASEALTVHHVGGVAVTTATGFGVTTGLAVFPPAADFGRVLAGVPSAPVTVTVTNTGNVTATFDSASVDGPFEVVDDACTGTVESEATCQIEVRYVPGADAAGDQTGTLGVTGTSNGRPLGAAVELAGFAAIATIDVAPATHDFGLVAVGRTIPTATTTITNTGNVTVTLGVDEIDDPALGLDTSACAGVSLDPGATCDVVASYTPTSPGPASATSLVGASAELAGGAHAVTPIEIALTGAAEAADLVVDVPDVEFGEAPPGSSSDPRTITVTNDGPDVTIDEVIVPDGFVVDEDGCTGVTLTTGASCMITIRFEPTQPGPAAGVLTIVGDATDTELTVTLTGFAPDGAVVVEPTDVSFGDVTLGERSAPEPVTVVNDSNATMTITAVGLQGASPAGSAASLRRQPAQEDVVVDGDFELVATGCVDRVLAPGDSCTVSAVFVPRTTGPSTSTVRVETDRGAASVALRGTGIPVTTAPSDPPTSVPTSPSRPTPPSGALPATGGTSPAVVLWLAAGSIAAGLALIGLRRRHRPPLGR